MMSGKGMSQENQRIRVLLTRFLHGKIGPPTRKVLSKKYAGQQ
jgi:hypothetical protein